MSKKRSVEVISWNFLSTPSSERILLGLVEKTFLCDCGCHGRCTYNGILDIMAWSMAHLLLGAPPASRHDGSPWTKDDKYRVQLHAKGSAEGTGPGLKPCSGSRAGPATRCAGDARQTGQTCPFGISLRMPCGGTAGAPVHPSGVICSCRTSLPVPCSVALGLPWR
eukprot:11631754-Alexandrium_andersonii.AAC.1